MLWTKLKPMVMTAFSTGDCTAALKQEYAIAKDELGIEPEYSSFWVPMSYAVFNPGATLMFVIPSFLILKYTGIPISISFMVTLVILVL